MWYHNRAQQILGFKLTTQASSSYILLALGKFYFTLFLLFNWQITMNRSLPIEQVRINYYHYKTGNGVKLKIGN